MQNNPEIKPNKGQSIRAEYHGAIVRNLHQNNATATHDRSREIRRSSIFSGPAKMVLGIGISVLKLIGRGIKGSLKLLKPIDRKKKLTSSKTEADSLPHEEEL